MTGLKAALRGLAHRGASTIMILIVALVAAAAATTGPIYFAASKTSILQDTMTSAVETGHGFEVVQTGAIASLLGPLAADVDHELASDLGGQSGVRRLFRPPIDALEALVVYQPLQVEIPLVWRSGVCAQLRITGHCPVAPGQVIISSSLAVGNGWHTGQRLRFFSWGTLTVTGIYRPPDASLDYWFGRGQAYFAHEMPLRKPTDSGYDAMFTTRGTMEAAPVANQGSAVVDELLNVGHVGVADVGRLLTGMTALNGSAQLAQQQALVSTTIPDTLRSVRAGWAAVAVPVVLITAQLLALSWLLLFLAVTDAVEARGPEIALAKLRGHGRARTLAFGLGEPVLLLALALPLGTLLGWGATAVLGRALLRPGTPVGLPAAGWAAAAVATAGGLVAVLLAARRTLRRPVVEQWRRSGRRAADRGWVVDAVLLTGAIAGLVNLAAGGHIGSASGSVLSLLVPGLLGLSVAVVASRLLPLACRAAFGPTSRRGGTGLYLALRHVARRPGGVRTVIVLATAFALASFAVAAWSVGHDNEQAVAGAQIGAPTVLTVSVPPGKDLGAIVGHADPGGRMATAVDVYVSLTSGSSGQVTLGVDPQRFARIAAWQPGFAAEPLQALAARLAPPASPPVTLTGTALRVTVSVHSLSPPGAQLTADVTSGSSPISLGRLPARGTVTLTSQLTGCPCTLVDLRVALPPGQTGSAQGTLTFGGLQAGGPGGWTAAASLGDAARWRAGSAGHSADTLSASPAGLRWRFSSPGTADPVIAPADRPVPLPAIISAALIGGRRGTFIGLGLDGSPLPLTLVAAATAVPSAPASGTIVDRRYAELAAGSDLSQVTRQVWLAAGARRVIQPRLAAAGVRVLSAQSATAEATLLGRQGPGLASVLFLADAAAAALLAAGAAVLGLYLSARRRRYEYAALAAAGMSHRSLRRALVAELAVVLGFGTITGIGAGLAAAALALPSVPEFITRPAAPPLSYAPAAAPLAALLGTAVGLLLVAAASASFMLIRGVRLDLLREAPA